VIVLASLDEIAERWSEFLPAWPVSGTHQHVWIEPPAPQVDASNLKLLAQFFFERELRIDIPGLDSVSVVLSPAGGGTIVPVDVEVAPRLKLRVGSLPISLRLSSNLLRPVRHIPPSLPGQPDTFEPDTDVDHVDIVLAGVTVSIDGDGNADLDVASRIDLPPCMIGGSGIVIEASGLEVHLQGDTPPPGRSAGWRGLYLASGGIHLPGELAGLGTLTVSNAYIGNGGFSGTVGNTWTPALPATLGGVVLRVESVALTFIQNALTASRIQAAMTLPFFDQPLGVDLALGLNGDFTVRLSAEQPPGVTRTPEGLIEFEKPGILKLRVASLAFEKHGNDFLVKLSGSIKLLYGGFDWPEVDVRELSIDKDGRVHIDGGWLDLPKSVSFDFDGFMMELTKIGFGNTDDGRRWIGFSGQISLVDELSFSASVDGLKILWDASGHVDLELSDIKVDFEVPGAVAFDGFVKYFQDPSTKGFKGDVKLVLEAAEIAFDAQLMVGRGADPPVYNFFFVLIDAELPAGIPLGQTNLAIYGFAGLFGDNVTPDLSKGSSIPDDAAKTEWFKWYLAPQIGATWVDKWAKSRGSLALGAGVTLGTAADNGFALSGKTVFILLIPGPLLLIDGKANMLKDRSELAQNKQGTYQALAVLDGRAGTFLINIEPHFQYPPLDPGMGSTLDAIGVAEGFFDFNHPDAWHVYLGQQPPPKRIRGIVARILNADAYLMLDHDGMRLGASTGIDKHYDYGPLAVALKAIIAGDATVSWRPTQLHGQLTIDGLAALRAFGCSASLIVAAALIVDTPHPFHVVGDVRVELGMPWPLPSPSADIHLEWGSADEPPADPPPSVASFAAEHLRVTRSWDLTEGHDSSMEHLAGVAPAADSARGGPPPPAPIIPLDAKVLINFNRPVVDRALVGSNGGPVPQPERSGAFEILHELLAVILEKEDGNAWQTVTSRQEGTGDLFGMWLPLPEGAQAAGKLQLWSRSPFTYTRNVGRSYGDWFTGQNREYPCVPMESATSWCFDFEEMRPHALPSLFVVGDLVFEFLFTSPSEQPQVVDYASALTSTKRALLLPALGSMPLRITPPAPAAAFSVSASHATPKVALTVHAFRNGQVVATDTSAAAGDVELTVQASGIEYVELSAAPGPRRSEAVRIMRACLTLQTDQDRADRVRLIRSRIEEQLSAGASWCGEDHLFDSNARYRLTVKTQIRKWRDGQELSATPHDDVRYFQTQGPPGFFPTQGPLGFEDQGALRDLSTYVDPVSSVPALPTSGGAAPPAYRGYDLRLVFTENYMERLYKGTGHDLAMTLLDQNGRPVQSATGLPVPVATEWDRDPYGVLSPADQLWTWTIGRPAVTAAGCSPSVGVECAVKRSSLEGRLREAPLPPRTLIEARVSAPGAPPLHRFTFTTSRFVTFLHHVQSFAGAVLDHAIGAPGGPGLTPDQLMRLGQMIQGRRQAGSAYDATGESPAFDELAATIFKLDRPRPSDTLTIALLRDDVRRYGLLLESPEPLDWGRISLTVSRTTVATPADLPARGPALIINGALQPTAVSGAPDYNAEWVEVLLRTDIDLNGWSIEHAGGLGAPTGFTTYYRFGSEPLMSAGTVIRVHSGMPTGPGPATERVDRYVTLAGGIPAWRLKSAGDLLRLVDVSGTEVQRRSILPSGAFQGVEAVIIRNEDQTRALLFFPQSADVPVGDVPDGRLRIAWIFKRDMGEKERLLRRWGSSLSEETAVEFGVMSSP